ncbi:MAG: hypothetical protein LW686_00125 [Ilumatobacteraceae bacterium]|nr:hypothetical protein [Ilumatobacteraceae bacterium]
MGHSVVIDFKGDDVSDFGRQFWIDGDDVTDVNGGLHGAAHDVQVHLV